MSLEVLAAVNEFSAALVLAQRAMFSGTDPLTALLDAGIAAVFTEDRVELWGFGYVTSFPAPDGLHGLFGCYEAPAAPQAVPTDCDAYHPDGWDCERQHLPEEPHYTSAEGGIYWTDSGDFWPGVCGDVPPEADDAEEALDERLRAAGIDPDTCVQKVMDRVERGLAQPEGEPPPSEWPEPAPPEGPTTRRADPLHRFRGHLHRLCRKYAAARWEELSDPALKNAAKMARYQLMSVWYDGAETTKDKPGDMKPVDPRWYDGSLSADVVGSLAWLSTVSDEQFKAAANAVLGVTR